MSNCLNPAHWGQSCEEIFFALPSGRLIEGDGGYPAPTAANRNGWRRGHGRIQERWLTALRFAADRGVTSLDISQAINLDNRKANSLLHNMALVGLLRRTGELQHRKGCRARVVYEITNEGRQYMAEVSV